MSYGHISSSDLSLLPKFVTQKKVRFFNDFDHIFIEKHIFLISFSLKLSLGQNFFIT